MEVKGDLVETLKEGGDVIKATNQDDYLSSSILNGLERSMIAAVKL